MSDRSADACAVVRMDDERVDFSVMARCLREPLEEDVVDLIPLLPGRGGIVAEGLPPHVAAQCIALLRLEGIAAESIPQSKVVDLPELLTLRSCGPADAVLFYVADEQRGVVKWPEVIWVDLVAVDEHTTEQFEDWELRGNDQGATVRRVQSQRLVMKRPIFVDVVSYDPWRRLRIPQERFDFAATGLPIFPTRRENLIALAATIGTKATSASLGPGLDWLETRTPPQEHRLQSHAIYEGYLRWQLTREFLD